MPTMPLQHILFWIAATFAPPDTTQILVKGPDVTAAWTRVDSGWSYSEDRTVYSIDGTTVKTVDATGKSENSDLGSLVKPLKDHDWQKSPTLKLASGETFTKEGATFVLTPRSDTPVERRTVIQYRLKTAATQLTIQIAADGSVSVQGQTVSLEKLSTELTSLSVPKERRVVVLISENVKFDRVAKVMDAVKSAGFAEPSMKTASNPPEPAKPETAPGPTWAELLGGKSPRSTLTKAPNQMKTLLLALTVYSAEYNEWPKKLTDLPAKYFDNKPIDYAPYLYRRPSKEDLQKNSAEFAVLLLKEQPGLPKGALVGYADGHVASVEDRQQVEKLFPSESASVALAFHIVPNGIGSSRTPIYPFFAGQTHDEFADVAIRELAEKGPQAARPADGDLQWFELAAELKDSDALIGKYKDKKYILLCARKPYVLLPEGQGKDAWRVEQVSTAIDDGMPDSHTIGIRLDERGGKLFGALTEANLQNRLAVVVGGKVISTPVIHDRISREFRIAGNFSEREAKELATRLQAGANAGKKGEKP